MKDLRELATEILESIKDELLKQTHPMKHTNGYPSYAVPKGTIIDMIPLCRKVVESKLLSFHEQASKDMYPKEFVEWLLTSCDTGIDDDETQMKWIVEVETHVIEYMTTKQALKFWKDNIQGK